MVREALLVVDMLKDFIYENGALYLGDVAGNVLSEAEKIVKKAKIKNVPIFYICDSHHNEDAEFEIFPKHCLQHTIGGQVVEEIKPGENDYIILKRRYSAFFGTDLDLYLREMGIIRIVLIGVCTNICILYTAASARMLNYKVDIIRDAVGSFDREAHQFALKELKNTLGANLLTTSEYIKKIESIQDRLHL